MEERITKQELMKLYGVDRVTIEEWRKNLGLPLIRISGTFISLKIKGLV